MEFLCEVSEAQTAREVNSRMKCVTKIMAMPGTRTLVADLCMSGLAACDEETQVYGRSSTRDNLECGCKMNAQARIDTLV